MEAMARYIVDRDPDVRLELRKVSRLVEVITYVLAECAAGRQQHQSDAEKTKSAHLPSPPREYTFRIGPKADDTGRTLVAVNPDAFCTTVNSTLTRGRSMRSDRHGSSKVWELSRWCSKLVYWAHFFSELDVSISLIARLSVA